MQQPCFSSSPLTKNEFCVSAQAVTPCCLRTQVKLSLSFTFFPFFLRWADFPVDFSLASSLISAAVRICASQTAVYKSPKRLLIQHGWVGKSEVAATLRAQRDQLAQLLTPTFTHTQACTQTHWPHSVREVRSQRESPAEAMERRTFWLFVSLPLFLFHSHFTSTCPRLWSPPTRSTSEITAATSCCTGARVLIAINASSLAVVCVCVCIGVCLFVKWVRKQSTTSKYKRRNINK